MRAAFLFLPRLLMHESREADNLRTCIIMTAKILRFIPKPPSLKAERPEYGKNLRPLVMALLFAPENRFPSMRQWYRSQFAAGGCRESRRQSCWRVIRHGWATAEKRSDGRWECTLTDAGFDIARNGIPKRSKRRKKTGSAGRQSMGVVIRFRNE